MPVSFSQIAAKEATVTFKFDAETTITLVYYPNKLTRKMAAEVEAGVTNDSDLFSQLIKSWDVLDDDGEMFPLSRIDEIGLGFMQQVAQAIIDNLRPEARAPHLNGHR